MTVKRRRKSDLEEHRPLLRRVPHYLLYPTLGACIGLGSPVGAFMMRFWLADPILKGLWVRHELQYNFLFYAYMGIGTVLAFILFGYFLGVRSEKQRVSNRIMSARIDELHLKSVTDSLTGTYSHGYLHEILELELQRSLTEKTPLSALIIDIDDFKQVNDTHGHLFGDRVIKETAETIVSNVRSEDILGRYGGDEFLVIMPGADNPTAAQAAERICRGVAQNGYGTTVSIGAATYSGRESQGAKDLLHDADANLYQAKRDGKNRVSLAAKAGFGARKDAPT